MLYLQKSIFDQMPELVRWLLSRESMDLMGFVGIALIVAGSCLTFYLDTTSQQA